MKKYLLPMGAVLMGGVFMMAGCGSSTTSTSQNPATPSVAAADATPATTTTVAMATSTSSTPKTVTTKTTTQQKMSYYNGISGADKNGSVTTAYSTTATTYKNDGFYYQFVNCHGSPSILHVKAGAKFMLDNRDNKAHTVVLGYSTYRLPAYGYYVATAPSTLGTQHLVCDGGGAALLSVEK